MTNLLMKRLFIGIKIHPNQKLLDFYSKLRTTLKDEQIKWVPAENFHLTLKFLGDTPTSLVPKIIDSLKSLIVDFERFGVEVCGLGSFKKQRRTNVIWLGLKNIEILTDLAEKVDNAIGKLGFEPESRNFKAHLTLGRVKYIADENRVQELINEFGNCNFQLVDIESIELFESVLQKTWPQYYSMYKVEL